MGAQGCHQTVPHSPYRMGMGWCTARGGRLGPGAWMHGTGPPACQPWAPPPPAARPAGRCGLQGRRLDTRRACPCACLQVDGAPSPAGAPGTGTRSVDPAAAALPGVTVDQDGIRRTVRAESDKRLGEQPAACCLVAGLTGWRLPLQAGPCSHGLRAPHPPPTPTSTPNPTLTPVLPACQLHAARLRAAALLSSTPPLAPHSARRLQGRAAGFGGGLRRCAHAHTPCGRVLR
jgi:hypothetical protein